ncbi:hypothetical protein C1645_812994 [Glomus cerebriforme]|uniref:TLDc domain-containing protein n=1 Tax=Glomus cerebriforme TaxID=658196 RepID=A0A397TJV8_9GLOM|nr:hypothetical protein C1645_812994 [Glomus cerebriforme]
MERRLGRLGIFIPIIRYYSISSEDFLLKIYYPFKELLPNDLINNIFKYHMVSKNKLNINIQPPRSPKFVHSTIIKSQHLNLFSRLIDKKENLYYNHYNGVGYNPYRFNLIYRASKDSNTAAAFHEKLPAFDGGSNGTNLYCLNNGDIWYNNNPSSYPKIDIPFVVNVDDYEVIQVIKPK